MGRETNKQRRERQASSAREKAAVARAAQARVDQRRRARTILSSVLALGVVIAVIAVIAVTQSGSGKQSLSGNRSPAPTSLVDQVTNVAATDLDTVGQGTADLNAKAINDTALTDNGKPELLAILGEFCPYCAAERWPMIVALSRFGTFKDLNTIKSSSTDVDPNTSTFSFYKSSYTSRYLSFVPVEAEDRAQNTLQSPTAAQVALWKKYTGQGSFPFLDFGGRYYINGPSFDPGDLAGLTWDQIAADLKDTSSKVAKDILGEANIITAMICKLTNGQPAGVCSAAGVSKISLPSA